MIRFLSPEEVHVFRTIRLEALQMEPEAFASTYDGWAALTDEEWRRRLVRCSVICAFDGEVAVGIMGLLPDDPELELVMVYLRVGLRGKGLAERMLNRLVDLARSRGAQRLVLRAASGNAPAIRFYQKVGFRLMADSPEDDGDLRMELPLSP